MAPLDPELLADEIEHLKKADPSIFVIAFPHWGPNYKWRTKGQTRQADILIEAGADLVIGHGAHMMQEVEQRGGRWIVYSLGNFMFNSPGRYRLLNAPPYSFLAKLVVRDHAKGLAPVLRLHPIFTDNLRNGYRTRFLKRPEFDEVVRLLVEKSPTPTTLLSQMVTGIDEIGRHIDFDLGIVPEATPITKKTRTRETNTSEQSEITCLECGRKFKSLHTHLSRAHKMRSSEYRKKWGLSEKHALKVPSIDNM